jgi:hypothetical protein
MAHEFNIGVVAEQDVVTSLPDNASRMTDEEVQECNESFSHLGPIKMQCDMSGTSVLAYNRDRTYTQIFAGEAAQHLISHTGLTPMGKGYFTPSLIPGDAYVTWTEVYQENGFDF